MNRQRFKACYKCTRPWKKPGCHDTCKDYLDEKAAHEEDKKKIAAERAKRDFLNYVEKKRTARIDKIMKK